MMALAMVNPGQLVPVATRMFLAFMSFWPNPKYGSRWR
jgi:hypothetical protein